MSPELYIQDELHSWLENSLHDFIAIRKIKDQTQSMLGGNRKDEMLKKKQRIEKAVEDFEAKSSQKLPLSEYPAATAVRKASQQQRSKSTVPPDYQKNAGRQYLHDMVKKAGRRVQAARAGRTISSSILEEDRVTPPILRTFLFSASSRDRSSPDSLRTSSKSMAAQEDYRSKPHVSFTSGRLEAALQLPTFPEYCASLNIDMEKGTTNAKILRRAEEAVARLKTLEKRMNEFEKGARKHNAQEMYYRSQRRNHTSIARPVAATPVPSHRKAQSLLAGEERHKFDQECELTKVGVQRSSDVITRRLEQFEKQQQTQNQRTIDIMDRIQMEKAFILRKKIQLVYSDNEHFKDYGRVIGKFGEIKQSTEQARKVRVETSRQQSHLYEALLEVLRVQEEEPSTTQLQLLESVRRVLEQGWVLQASDYFLVVDM